MANISFARGSVSIAHESEAVVRRFVSEFLVPWACEDTQYGIYLRPLDDIETVMNAEGMYVFSSDFEGYGRWTFSHTLSALGGIVREVSGEDFYVELLGLEHPLSVEFEFCDEEGGCGVLYEACLGFEFCGGEVSLVCEEVSEFEYVRENLDALGFDVCELLDDEVDEGALV